MVGASPFSTILAVRLGPNLKGLSCGLAYLAKRIDAGAVGVPVVNLSLMDPNVSSAGVQAGLRKLVRRGALIVAATGNRGQGSRLGFPARLPHVLAIGDDEGRALLPGPQLDLVAPGGNLAAPSPDDMTALARQKEPTTSWATAVASGAAAAVWGAHPSGSEMTAQQLAYVLRVTAGGRGAWRARRGFGLIDVGRALDADANAIPVDDESEPNETAALASASDNTVRLHCAKTCSVGGILGTTDDPQDWWHVAVPAGQRACASLANAPGVRVRMRPSGRRGVAYAVVTTNRKLASYTLRVRLAGRC
jgi:hypothetical protein